MMTTAKVTASLRKLPVAQRILLAQDLWDSVMGDVAATELTAAEKKQIDRDLAAYRRNPKAVLTWEQAKAEVRRGRRK